MNIVIRDVVEKYSNMLMQIAYQRTFNKSDSEDIVQDTFVRLIKHINKIENEDIEVEDIKYIIDTIKLK